MPDDIAFTFVPAVREKTPAVFALAGPTGGGKTWTALELATGLAGDKKIALISTEGRRDLYYADHFRFDRVGLEPPYTPTRFLAAMKAAQAAGYGVIIVDSFSDEYVGEGGLVDMAAAERSPNEAAKWARPKAQHKLVIRWVRNSARTHLIFCLRAEEKVKLVKVRDEHGKETTKVEPQGFQPICEKAFMFDMMESALLLPEMRDREGNVLLADARGVPQWIKPMQQHLQFFPDRKPITREAGRALAEWCAGGAPRPAAPPEPPLRERCLAAARRGTAALRDFWEGLDREERAELRAFVGTPDQPGEARHIASDADEREAREDLFDRPKTAPGAPGSDA